MNNIPPDNIQIKSNACSFRLDSLLFEGWRPYFWLVVACFFIYLKTLTFRFTGLDDDRLILNHYWFLRDFKNILECFKQGVFLGGGFDLFYRPILLVSLMLDAHIGGISPVVYHFTNILLHACSAILLFQLFVKLSYSRKLSFFIASLFAVHPALVQAVAWIPGRNDSLLMVFAVSAFIFFINYIETQKPIDLFFTILFFNLAIYTKETAAMLAPAGFIYYQALSINKLRHRNAYLLSGVLLVSVLAWLTLRHFSTILPEHYTSQSIKEGLKQVLTVLIIYAGKIELPFNLSVYPTLEDTSLFCGSISVVLTAAALLLTPKIRLKYSFFGLIWFIFFLLPSFLLLSQRLSEHRLYLPIIGIFIVLAEVDWIKTGLTKKLVSIMGVIAITVFAVISFVHIDVFMNELVFWKSAAKTTPHHTSVHEHLASIYTGYGEEALAEQELHKAIALAPANGSAHINLAVLYADKKNFSEAERQFYAASDIKMDMDALYYCWGLLRFEEGKDNDAESLWKKSIELNPNFMNAYGSLAEFYYIKDNAAGCAYYTKQLKDRFSYSINFAGVPKANKRGWLYFFSRTAF